METLQINNHEDFEKFVGLLEQARECLENEEQVEKELQKNLKSGKTQFTFEDINPVFKELGYYPETIKQYCEMRGVQNPFILEQFAGATYRNFRGEVVPLFDAVEDAIFLNTPLVYFLALGVLKKQIQDIIEHLQRIENHDFKNVFTDEQKEILAQKVTALLVSKKDYKDITVEVFDNTLSSMKISFTSCGASKEKFESWNRMVIEDRLFSREMIEEFLRDVDELWGEELELLNNDTFRYRLSPELENICVNVLRGFPEDEVKQFVEDIQFNKRREYHLLAGRIIENLNDYLKSIDSRLTIEHVKGANKKLCSLLLDKKDDLEFYEDLQDMTNILKEMGSSKIAQGVLDNKFFSKTAKSIIKDASDWYKVKGNIFDKVHAYIEKNFDNVQEKILKDDWLTVRIISSENLFYVKGLWIYYFEH